MGMNISVLVVIGMIWLHNQVAGKLIWGLRVLMEIKVNFCLF